jgi:cyclopropane-fatty-acyl-phospholipid synthase
LFLLRRYLKALIRTGRLTLVFPDGSEQVFDGGRPGPAVTVRLHDRRLPRRIALRPELAAGEAYMDGTLTLEQGTVRDLFDLVTGNLGWQPGNPLNARNARIRRIRNFLSQSASPRIARRGVAHHYDLSNELFRCFLDDEMHYSCAFFTEANPEHDLDRAQEEKTDRIAAKLLLRPGQRILDIGCGWGALALQLRRRCDVDVTGITLSEEQTRFAEERAVAAGAEQRVRFRCQDYRDVEGTFDRIVSVGMFEHVGLPRYRTFFETLRRRLAPDGVALLHTIGRADGPGITDDWTAKYIFPRGYVPALSEIVKWIERAGLYVTDIEVLRLHYAWTLEQWQRRFAAHRKELRDRFDDRFCRMFEWYLAASEYAFRNMGHVVFQIQLALRQDAVPLTRDYLFPGIPAHGPGGARSDVEVSRPSSRS